MWLNVRLMRMMNFWLNYLLFAPHFSASPISPSSLHMLLAMSFCVQFNFMAICWRRRLSLVADISARLFVCSFARQQTLWLSAVHHPHPHPHPYPHCHRFWQSCAQIACSKNSMGVSVTGLSLKLWIGWVVAVTIVAIKHVSSASFSAVFPLPPTETFLAVSLLTFYVEAHKIVVHSMSVCVCVCMYFEWLCRYHWCWFMMMTCARCIHV